MMWNFDKMEQTNNSQSGASEEQESGTDEDQSKLDQVNVSQGVEVEVKVCQGVEQVELMGGKVTRYGDKPQKNH